MRNQLSAFHVDKRLHGALLKQAILKQLSQAQALVTESVYWDGAGGWIVPCSLYALATLHGDMAPFEKFSDHEIDWDDRVRDEDLYEQWAGVPGWLAPLSDDIFGRLAPAEAETFPLEFWQAIPVGANLRGIKERLTHWALVDPSHGVLVCADAQGKELINRVVTLLETSFNGLAVAEAEWSAAGGAAWDYVDSKRPTRESPELYAVVAAARAADSYNCWEGLGDAASALGFGKSGYRRYLARLQEHKLLELLRTAPSG